MDDDPHAKIEQMRRRFARAHAMAFGERPPGEEHRVWVDHEAIAAAIDDAYDLGRLWKFSGLAELSASDPAVPPPLRALLAAHGDTQLRYLAGPAALAAAGALWLVVGLAPWGVGAGLIAAGVISAYLGGLFADDLLAKHGKSIPWSRRRRLDAALEALRAAPFAVVVRDKLVENVPSLSWLDARDAELEDAGDASAQRTRELEEVRERLRSARSRLGERGPDATIEGLEQAIRAEASLAQRVARVRAEIAVRHAAIRKQIDGLRDRVEVEALRARAAALTGGPAATTPEWVAAELEIDVADLRAEVDALRAEVAEDERRFRAMNEVSALG